LLVTVLMGNIETSAPADLQLPESLKPPVLDKDVDESNLVILDDGTIVGRPSMTE
jgi:hypothetical protein